MTDFIYIDLWAVVHFITGYLLYSYLKLEPITAIVLIVGFEIIEPYMEGFRKEHKTDTFWDLVLGIAGYYIARGGI